MTHLKPTALTHLVTDGRSDHPTRADLWKRAYALLTVLGGASGTAAIVLPFTWGISPLDASVPNEFRLLVPAFLMTPLIAAASVRWLRTGELRPIERDLAVLAGAATAVSTLAFIVSGLITLWPETLLDWTAMLLPIVVLVVAGWLLTSGWASRDIKSIAVMQAAFAANSTFCLVGFAGDWQVGAWCTLATVFSYGVQIRCAVAWLNAERVNGSRPARLA